MLSIIIGLLSGLICLIIYPIKLLPKVIYFPLVMKDSFRFLYKDPKLGSNIKFIGYLTIFCLGIISLPLFILGSISFGFVRGFYIGFKNIFELSSYLKNDSDYVEIWLLTSLSNLRKEPNPLPEGKRPFEIGVFKSLSTLISITIFSVIGGPAIALVISLQLPILFYRVIANLNWKKDWIVNSFLSTLLCSIVVIAPPLLLVGAVCYYFVLGGIRGFTKGIRSSFNLMLNDLHNIHIVFLKIRSKRRIAY